MNPHISIRRSFLSGRLTGQVAGASAAGADGAKLRLFDLSLLPRWGIKGRGALSWLTTAGAATPGGDNRARRQSDGSLVVQLSPVEVLILSSLPDGQSHLAETVDALPLAGHDACYPAPRRDSHCWFMITGNDTPRMFAKLCGVNLVADKFADGSVAQTSVARLSAIVIRNDIANSFSVSLLADSASAEYLWDCVLDAMAEFSGAVASPDEISHRSTT
jgi:sarcosine oxidase subunit gamma